MGFFDFFKRKSEIVEEKEKIRFANLDSWIDKKSNEIKDREKVFLGSINNRFDKLLEDLQEGIEKLENINWQKIREDEKVKLIVQENVSNYILRLEQLKTDLKALKEKDRKKEKFVSIFEIFDKRSGMNFQKANYLIGRELATINYSVKGFLKDFDSIQNNNQKLVKDIEAISFIKNKIEEFKEKEKLLDEITREVKNFDNKIEKTEKNMEDSQSEIEKIKQTEEFLENEKTRKEYELLKEKRNVKMQELRNSIDFKKIAGMWHENEKEMKIIKMYKTDFEGAFQKDKEKILQKLVNSLENKERVSALLLELMKLDEKIKNTKLGKSMTSDINEKIKKSETELIELTRKKQEANAKIEKIHSKKEGILQEIKNSLRDDFDVELAIS